MRADKKCDLKKLQKDPIMLIRQKNAGKNSVLVNASVLAIAYSG